MTSSDWVIYTGTKGLLTLIMHAGYWLSSIHVDMSSLHVLAREANLASSPGRPLSALLHTGAAMGTKL